MDTINGSFTPQGNGTLAGTGKRWVSILRYVPYTIHRNRDGEPLFSIVLILVSVPVLLPVPCGMYEPQHCSGEINFYWNKNVCEFGIGHNVLTRICDEILVVQNVSKTPAMSLQWSQNVL